MLIQFRGGHGSLLPASAGGQPVCESEYASPELSDVRVKFPMNLNGRKDDLRRPGQTASMKISNVQIEYDITSYLNGCFIVENLLV